MATQKPISTISYNSESFLVEKLNLWYSSHLIQSFMYIKHVGEDGDKNHIHLYLEPNKRLDPMDLKEELKEFIPGQKLPLGVMTFRSSKQEDWLLYAVHDSSYLKLKYNGGEKNEKLPYSWQDIKSSEPSLVETLFIRAQSYQLHSVPNLATRLKNGENRLSLILEGENPYTVNAVFHALESNDYTRLQEELRKLMEEYITLEDKYNSLMAAIESAGLTLTIQSDGSTMIE